MTFSLLQLSRTELDAIADARLPEGLADRLEQDALPPAFVAARAIELAKAGHPTPWSTTFLIVNNDDLRVIGGCGFKTAPMNGRVEIGYGVAPSAQGRGAASAAVQLLVRMAFDAGAAEVLAEVAPTNHASTRVVQKVGFEQVGERVDHDNEYLIQWLKRREA